MAYIERDKIEKFFDGIYDCADLTFEPNDHCCDADDCAHCKWYETKNAIRKRILSIPAADVRPVVLCRDCEYWKQWDNTTHYLCTYVAGAKFIRNAEDFCSRGAKREES